MPVISVAQVVEQSRELQVKDIDILQPFLKKGGWITRSISPFLDLTSVLDAGTYEAEPTDSKIAVYRMVIAIHPQLSELLMEFCKEDEESSAYANFLTLMTAKMNSARGTDTSLVKHQILNFLPPNTFTPISAREKDLRGWHSRWTARALCPLQFVHEFDQDPIHFMKSVQNGQFKPLAKLSLQWPPYPPQLGV